MTIGIIIYGTTRGRSPDLSSSQEATRTVKAYDNNIFINAITRGRSPDLSSSITTTI